MLLVMFGLNPRTGRMINSQMNDKNSEQEDQREVVMAERDILESRRYYQKNQNRYNNGSYPLYNSEKEEI